MKMFFFFLLFFFLFSFFLTWESHHSYRSRTLVNDERALCHLWFIQRIIHDCTDVNFAWASLEINEHRTCQLRQRYQVVFLVRNWFFHSPDWSLNTSYVRASSVDGMWKRNFVLNWPFSMRVTTYSKFNIIMKPVYE